MNGRRTKDWIIRAAAALGVSVTRRTTNAQLTELLRTLHPVEPGTPLIRVGPDRDGGYLLPDDLDGIEYCLSPGVAAQSDFELVLAQRGMRVCLADYSVDGPAHDHPNFVFDKKFVSVRSNDIEMTLDEWKAARTADYQGDMILQMDIEGAEFETLLGTSASLLSQFRIMIVEFHNLQRLFIKPYFDLASHVFRKVLQTHTVVHIHPNNFSGSVKSGGLEIPRVAEFTFYRNDRLSGRSYRTDFPHALDRDNVEHTPLALPEAWYRTDD